jgi:hypothetical protein
VTEDEVVDMFSYDAPVGTQRDRYTKLRIKGLEFAMMINECCPESREKDLAFSQLQSAIQWANSAISSNEKPGPAPERLPQRNQGGK